MTDITHLHSVYLANTESDTENVRGGLCEAVIKRVTQPE